MARLCILCGHVRGIHSFHRFPMGPVRIEWVNFVERHGVNPNNINERTLLCSRHFTADNFHATAVRRRLKPDAIPTIVVGGIIEVAVVDNEILPEENIVEVIVGAQNEMAGEIVADHDVVQEIVGLDDIVDDIVGDDNEEIQEILGVDDLMVEIVDGDVEEVILGVHDVAQHEIDVAADEELLANVLVMERRRGDAQIDGPVPDQHQLGPMDAQCPSCHAKHFLQERTAGHFSLCCGNGKILLTGDRVLRPVPIVLRRLMTENSAQDRHFQSHMRQYNNSFAFASMVSRNIQQPPGRGPPVFALHGQVYNLISDANPRPDVNPRFCQLYFLNTDEAIEGRTNTHTACRSQVMEVLDRLLREVNPYAASFRTMREQWDLEQVAAAAENPPRQPQTVTMHFVSDNRDPRRYNLPAGNEVAAVFVGNDGNPPESTDFVLYDRNPNPDPRVSIRRMNSTNRHADPLLYPLFFPFGESGWAQYLRHGGPRQTAAHQRITIKEFSCYRLAVRYNGLNEPDESFSAIHQGRFLLQQYVCDQYVRMEANNLMYIRYHQDSLRVESYQGLFDHLQDQDADLNADVGRRFILPSTFHGGPRNMKQNYQDAMAIVRKYGKPDLFITFTCNPKWPEITENLPQNVTASDRPDLVGRVFNQKLKQLMSDINTTNVFGNVQAFVYVVEFQKRGLPHAHILVILQEGYKLRNAVDVDTFIRADIPDPATERRLYDILTTNMMHGPCGTQNPSNPCMVNGECSKKFPKAYTEETVYRAEGGYPAYRRPNNGRTALVRGTELGNEYVVPYNPYLLLKFNAHINVEVCSSVRSVMYLYKYVYKGHDAATLCVRSNDEIQRYIDTRYVSAPEAVWRLFGYNMHNRSHTIIRLAVHLEDMHNVIFRVGEIQNAVQRGAAANTHLTAYFNLNVADHRAHQLLYHEVPNYYRWDTSTRTWIRRMRACPDSTVIGRMYSVSPVDRQRFHLRLLLLYRRGCVSFADLRTVDDIMHLTFEDAAIALGLLENDVAWRQCLAEATLRDTPWQLRSLFVIICIHCSPTNPLALYNTFEEHLMADFARDRTMEQARWACLNAINQHLQLHGKSLQDFGLPVPDVLDAPLKDIYDAISEAERGDTLLQQLNAEQRIVYNRVMAAVEDDQPGTKLFFVNGPGGTGKTMLYSCLMSVLRGQGRTPLAVAFTGIAAGLLEGGRTVHSTFGLPFGTLNDQSTSTIRLQSQRATKIRDAALIVWDEAPMSPGLQLTVVDRLLKDIMRSDLPFGGKPFLFGGDFRQILPVVQRGTRSHIVNACIKLNALWSRMDILSLTRNMRADGDREFAAWLLQLGNGQIATLGGYENYIQVPDRLVYRGDLADFVFPERLTLDSLDTYSNKVILCSTNDYCRIINSSILRNRVDGLAQQYQSIDTVQCDDPQDAADYPLEFLHSLDPNGLPPHNLVLKIGTIVMLLRNLDPRRGLCNGTKMVVTELRRFNFKVRLLNARANQNEDFILPAIPLSTSEEDDLPFTLRRVQFPVRLAFSVTINKSQGQTFDRVGVFLPSPVFTHGQLYVALSRVRSAESVRIQTLDNADGHCYTDNVVFQEVL